MEDRLEEAQIPEIWETEQEKALSVRELKNLNFLWALRHLRGKYFVNKSINEAIAITRDGLGEWKTVTKSREQAVSIKLLDKLLESAAFWKEEPPKNRDPNIEKIIYFRQECKINYSTYLVIITVKAYRSQNYRKYYHHFLDDFIPDIKK